MGPNDETEKNEQTTNQPDEAPAGINPTDDPGPMPEGEPV